MLRAGVVTLVVVWIALGPVRAQQRTAQPRTDEPRTAATTTDVVLAAATITPATLARQVAALAADSLWRRVTPSPALERTAAYVIRQVEDSTVAAIRPAAAPQLRHGTRRYPLPGRIVQSDEEQFWLRLVYTPHKDNREILTEVGRSTAKRITVPFATAVRFAVPWLPEEIRYGATVLLTGRPTALFLQRASLADKTVLYLPPADMGTIARQAVVEELARVSRGAVVLVPDDSAHFAAQQVTRRRQPLRVVDAYLRDDPDVRSWVIEVWAPVMTDLLTRLGVDWVRARTASTPALRELFMLQVQLRHERAATDDTVPTAPTVWAWLEGSDSARTQQCVVVVAPLDQRGSLPRAASVDRLVREADPNTASLAGFIELIRAFRALAVRPRRSILFLATSGGGPGQLFWSSAEWLRSVHDCGLVLSLVVDLGKGGPMAGDSAVVAGLDEVSLALPPTWIAAMHPELGLTVVDGGSVTAPSSDAFAFSRQLIPSLALYGGLASDSAGAHPAGGMALDPERTVRLLRLLFYVTQAAADTLELPKWTVTGRQRVFRRP